MLILKLVLIVLNIFYLEFIQVLYNIDTVQESRRKSKPEHTRDKDCQSQPIKLKKIMTITMTATKQHTRKAYQEGYKTTSEELIKGKIILPRFLMMMSGDDEKSLPRLSTFTIQKGIQGLVGEPKTIKRLRSGDLLIEVDRESYSTNLLAITELTNVHVKVSPHRTFKHLKMVSSGLPSLRIQQERNSLNNSKSKESRTHV